MSCEKVKAYLESVGFGDRFVEREMTADTVAHAAEAIGCTEAEIAKTMSFMLKDESVIVIVASGDTKIANAKFKATFGCKAAMLPFDRVEELTGHAPGGVCPFALREGATPFSCTAFSFIFATLGVCFLANPITIVKQTLALEKPLEALFFMLGFSICTSVIAYTLYTVGLIGTKPDVASIAATIDPIVATLIGFFVLEQSLDIFQIIGIFAVV